MPITYVKERENNFDEKLAGLAPRSLLIFRSPETPLKLDEQNIVSEEVFEQALANKPNILLWFKNSASADANGTTPANVLISELTVNNLFESYDIHLQPFVARDENAARKQGTISAERLEQQTLSTTPQICYETQSPYVIYGQKKDEKSGALKRRFPQDKPYDAIIRCIVTPIMKDDKIVGTKTQVFFEIHNPEAERYFQKNSGVFKHRGWDLRLQQTASDTAPVNATGVASLQPGEKRKVFVKEEVIEFKANDQGNKDLRGVTINGVGVVSKNNFDEKSYEGSLQTFVKSSYPDNTKKQEALAVWIRSLAHSQSHLYYQFISGVFTQYNNMLAERTENVMARQEAANINLSATIISSPECRMTADVQFYSAGTDGELVRTYAPAENARTDAMIDTTLTPVFNGDVIVATKVITRHEVANSLASADWLPDLYPYAVGWRQEALPQYTNAQWLDFAPRADEKIEALSAIEQDNWISDFEQTNSYSPVVLAKEKFIEPFKIKLQRQFGDKVSALSFLGVTAKLLPGNYPCCEVTLNCEVRDDTANPPKAQLKVIVKPYTLGGGYIANYAEAQFTPNSAFEKMLRNKNPDQATKVMGGLALSLTQEAGLILTLLRAVKTDAAPWEIELFVQHVDKILNPLKAKLGLPADKPFSPTLLSTSLREAGMTPRDAELISKFTAKKPGKDHSLFVLNVAAHPMRTQRALPKRSAVSYVPGSSVMLGEFLTERMVNQQRFNILSDVDISLKKNANGDLKNAEDIYQRNQQDKKNDSKVSSLFQQILLLIALIKSLQQITKYNPQDKNITSLINQAVVICTQAMNGFIEAGAGYKLSVLKGDEKSEFAVNFPDINAQLPSRERVNSTVEEQKLDFAKLDVVTEKLNQWSDTQQAAVSNIFERYMPPQGNPLAKQNVYTSADPHKTDGSYFDEKTSLKELVLDATKLEARMGGGLKGFARHHAFEEAFPKFKAQHADNVLNISLVDMMVTHRDFYVARELYKAEQGKKVSTSLQAAQQSLERTNLTSEQVESLVSGIKDLLVRNNQCVGMPENQHYELAKTHMAKICQQNPRVLLRFQSSIDYKTWRTGLYIPHVKYRHYYPLLDTLDKLLRNYHCERFALNGKDRFEKANEILKLMRYCATEKSYKKFLGKEPLRSKWIAQIESVRQELDFLARVYPNLPVDPYVPATTSKIDPSTLDSALTRDLPELGRGWKIAYWVTGLGWTAKDDHDKYNGAQGNLVGYRMPTDEYMAVMKKEWVSVEAAKPQPVSVASPAAGPAPNSAKAPKKVEHPPVVHIYSGESLPATPILRSVNPTASAAVAAATASPVVGAAHGDTASVLGVDDDVLVLTAHSAPVTPMQRPAAGDATAIPPMSPVASDDGSDSEHDHSPTAAAPSSTRKVIDTMLPRDDKRPARLRALTRELSDLQVSSSEGSPIDDHQADSVSNPGTVINPNKEKLPSRTPPKAMPTVTTVAKNDDNRSSVVPSLVRNHDDNS